MLLVPSQLVMHALHTFYLTASTAASGCLIIPLLLFKFLAVIISVALAPARNGLDGRITSYHLLQVTKAAAFCSFCNLAQAMAAYSVSDAVSTYYLYMT